MLTPRTRGFTLIELMIGLVLLGVIVMLALPSFVSMVHNMRLRNSAESILTGLQTARSQALQRNGRVEFLLINEALDPSNVAGYTANTTGPGWAVRVRNPDLSYEFVEGRTVEEGSAQASGAPPAVAMAATNLPGGNVITFNAVGQADITAGTVAHFDITHPLAASEDRFKCQPTGEMRCLRVEVSPGGRVRMCDPAVTDATDTRYCTP
jgi:type IV fimbrial biogenesis protein FimT